MWCAWWGSTTPRGERGVVWVGGGWGVGMAAGVAQLRLRGCLALEIMLSGEQVAALPRIPKNGQSPGLGIMGSGWAAVKLGTCHSVLSSTSHPSPRVPSNLCALRACSSHAPCP